ncbi:hypothetical protein WJX73_008754 [Symbiochloris irregularis]|uniref:Ribulose bisphosphate carboxylase/oxygenase activase, chloroplastic n=1 Tax=Symbiochloris irregularis TaxID=706552 RepID=A0AAW1PKD0_9CHLO
MGGLCRLHQCRQPYSEPFRSSLLRWQCKRACRTSATGAVEPIASDDDSKTGGKGKAKHRSSWTARDKGAAAENKDDYLAELGKSQNYNINVSHGQSSQHIDHLFTGDVLGKESDIASGALRGWEFRKFDHLVGDYFIAPAFLEAVAMHMVKNFLVDNAGFDKQVRVPLIMGIWGAKGQGKSFQCELAFKKLGVEAVIMSAGELEDEWAGRPGKLIRERYRRAAEMARARGRLTCLLINDIDAGVGHFDNTQLTVNNQMVTSTLMALADNPNTVSTGNAWIEDYHINRVPIIVTGNDLSRLFAPLIRDGRMTKFHWQPTRADLVGIVHQMFKDDGLSEGDVGILLDTFGQQPLDFFGALRAALYDGQILKWMKTEVVGKDLVHEDANLAELSRRLLKREGLPLFEPRNASLDELIAQGQRLAQEQEHVMTHKLSVEYNKHTGQSQGGLIGLKG